jgi:hypothetical protein
LTIVTSGERPLDEILLDAIPGGPAAAEQTEEAMALVGLLRDEVREDGDRVVPLAEAYDGERARVEVEATVGVDKVELRVGDGDEGLLNGGRRWCDVVLFRIQEEILGVVPVLDPRSPGR